MFVHVQVCMDLHKDNFFKLFVHLIALLTPKSSSPSSNIFKPVPEEGKHSLEIAI